MYACKNITQIDLYAKFPTNLAMIFIVFFLVNNYFRFVSRSSPELARNCPIVDRKLLGITFERQKYNLFPFCKNNFQVATSGSVNQK